MGLITPCTAFVDPHHTDATATQEDALKGKVFYNNDGKMTGNFIPEIDIEVLKKIYGNTVKMARYNKYSKGTDSASWWYRVEMTSDFVIDHIGQYTTGYEYDGISIIGTLIAIKANGKIIILPCDVSGRGYDIKDVCKIIVYKNKIFTKVNPNSGGNVDIFYR